MSKIIYPESDSLTSLVRNSMNDTLQSLNKAQGYCSYLIPKDFQYLKYVSNLGVKIAGLGKELNNCYSALGRVDKDFQNTISTIHEVTEILDVSSIEERGRLIK